jgi:hypothetical protein
MLLVAYVKIGIKTKTKGKNKLKTDSVVWDHKRTISTERPPLVGEVSANLFAVRWCHVVNVTDLYGRMLGFLDWNRYFSFQVALQLYSRG